MLSENKRIYSKTSINMDIQGPEGKVNTFISQKCTLTKSKEVVLAGQDKC